MSASKFAEWAGASTKTRVTGVTGVTSAGRPCVSNDLETSDKVTHAGLPRVTRVTTPRPSATEVTQVTRHPEAGLPENDHINQAGNTGNPGNPEIEQSAGVRWIADPAWWRDEYEERAAHREFGGNRPRAEAEALAWGELENRWNIDHGERVPRDICAGCRRPIGGVPTLDLIDGNRVHDVAEHGCLIRHGERWRGAASRALIAMGLRPPLEAECDPSGVASNARK